MKTLLKLIEKQAERSFEEKFRILEKDIARGLYELSNFSYSEHSLYPNEYHTEIKCFINAIITEEKKKKYIEKEITEKSEGILKNLKWVNALVENMGNE